MEKDNNEQQENSTKKIIEHVIIKRKDDSWIEAYSKNLSEDIKFDIRTLRYCDNYSVPRLGKTFGIPIQVIKQILKEDVVYDED